MPSINLPIQDSGVLIQVLIGVSYPFQEALKLAGQAIPKPIKGHFLIDTGASLTCVDASLIQPLDLPVIGSVNIQTPSTQGGTHQCKQYDAMLFLQDQGSAGFIIEAIPLLATHLKSQGVDGLIGRDILDRCTLIYNGTAKTFTLAY
ncbi:hypothetical protein FK216_06015 [Moraxellaceae bacterium AER2_44_116]|nr:aspartyl protease family protein [Moraxellaceae bacterium]TQC98412.1 hypothetical protein FK216_06015 [Moraxellaceae bacterium AER2_44_116]